MIRPDCFGHCLPRMHGGGSSGPMKDMQDGTTHDLTLEHEVARLADEVKRLKNQNHSLREKLNMEDEEDSVDLNQVSLEMSGKDDGDPSARVTTTALAAGAEPVTDFLRETSDGGLAQRSRSYKDMIKGTASNIVLQGSALSKSIPVQAAIYLVALAGVVFVLVATSLQLGAHHEEDGHHRRLGGGASPLLKNIAFCLTGCGLITFFVHVLKQPLILGYLLGGVLVGPLGLQISDEHTVSEIASLGLIFLLFMIGLELDMKELLKMGKVVLITGALQFPVCVLTMYGIFLGIQGAGISLGSGPYSALYCALGCSISSTMIVVKLLSENNEMERSNGRLSIGILIFQDIWAIVVLAIQPKISNPEILGILRTFAMIVVLIVVALAYAKFVMPAVLYFASKSVELMLVLSLSWCFFICCIAILPFMGLSMELAALIAGCALATFPYSAEFNGKIKYIRDFFITLFFAALGMKIPTPTAEAIFTAVLVAFVVLVIRWLGICLLVVLTGGGGRLGVLATINLSQISEFALVICSLGQQQSPPHIDDFTMTVVIWTFVILAILASFLIGNNHRIYIWMYGVERRVLRSLNFQTSEQTDDDGDGDEDHHRDIVVLGFHRIAFMLVAEIRAKNPDFAKKLHVIDFNRAIHPHLEERGVKCSYGDISAPDVLHHCFHGSPSLVLCTIPDSALQGITNGKLLKVVREVWPTAHCIVTADNPHQAEMLYASGADYVMRSAKLCAERLHELICKRSLEGENELEKLFQQYRKKDKDKRTSFLQHSL